MKYASQLCLLSLFGLFSTATIAAVNCKDISKSFNATRADNREILTAYAEKCPMTIKDARGFSLYDSAALHGRGELMKWLVNQHIAKEGQYSPAMIKLIQTGLRYLDIDAGVINGKLTSETKNAIKAYQKSIGQTPTGRISASWLPNFYRQLVKAMQNDFSILGYNIGAADGIIGAGTQKAMKSFREKHKVAVPDYPRVDDQLIYQLMLAQNEIQKQRLAKKRGRRKSCSHCKTKSLRSEKRASQKRSRT
ncbi:peptidoglycan-binding domain-containing protein [Suttonella ornithocola]|uniref:His-Xaa-Ser repeat protein HxsA n=1 Tax=Suttonella ornithocola TaxID=279832 RepID=A0A380RCJ3_9GAMM|nr:peptidoglycan-binding protein [Suttonella ornithocola]SUQ09739.1 His-Xaa-Ser repeat protein HxsA [Suttonella ornithocola]